MYDGKKIAVVVPAFNEATQIGKVLSTMPEFVDDVVVVDDASTDNTVEVVEGYNGKFDYRITITRHEQNRGVGAAIATGYKQTVKLGSDVAVVMAGDAQMDPNDLASLVAPVAAGTVDYAKGNRLFTGDAWKVIPRVRYLGNAMLSLLTKIASGYWHVADSQTGYTAVSVATLKMIDIDAIYPRYGMPNDFLVRLNVVNARVCDVPVKPVYNVGEKSGIKISRVLFTISFLLCRCFFWRLKEKYIIRDFHPLVFFYIFGLVSLVLGLTLGAIEIYTKFSVGSVPIASVVLVALLVISGSQFLCFAMWFDMQDNRDLR